MRDDTTYQYDYRKLLGKIKEKFGTQARFARALDIGRVSLSQRLNGKLQFTQNEIYFAIKLLDLECADIPTYFFQEDFRNKQQGGINGVMSWEEMKCQK